MESFRELLAQRDAVYGVFSKTNDPLFIKAMAKAGFDYVILDNEHGPNSPRETFALVQTAYANGMHPIVRVGKLSDIEIQRTLDLGVAGVQIPQIQCRADAENARKYTKFFPKGKRGVCAYVSAADCGLMDKNTYFPSQNDDVAVIIHIEGTEGIDNFDDIVAVEDIDIIFIGPYDLSQSLGIPGQVENPRLLDEVARLVARCREKGKNVGIFVDNVDAARRYKELGVKYISISVDVGIFSRACAALATDLKAL